MKIVHLTNYFQPQLGYQEYFLAREHVKSGHEVWVVTSDRYFPFPDYENTVKGVLGNRITGSREEKLSGINVIRLNVLFEFSARVKLIGLKKVISKISPDVVICHGMAAINSLEVAGLKKHLGFKLIYDDHMVSCVKKRGLAGSLFYSLFNFKKILKSGDKFIGVSDACADYIVENYKFPREKVLMLPLGADTELFKFSEKERFDFREKKGIDKDSVVILYTGKLTFRKSPHLIIESLKNKKTQIKENIVVILVGNFDNDYREFFDKYMKENSSYRVILLPMIDNRDLPAIYSSSDIACWPIEPTASMIEAMSMGLPIIGCNYLSERYKNNNGFPVEPGSLSELSEALFKLITDEQLRKTMGKNGRECIENEMSWKIIAKKFIEFN